MFPQELLPLTAKRKRDGETVIAHISDLHFTSRTNADEWLWRALTSDLRDRKNQIDVLAVTGDLIDSPFSGAITQFIGYEDEASQAFSKVSDYLLELCRELKIDPKEGLVVVPGNHDYRIKGMIQKGGQSTKFLSNFKDSFRPLLLPGLGLCILVIDSNVIEKGVNLATGLVDRNDLLSFYELASRLRTENADAWHSCTKIVMLHHHPMPIAATEVRGVLEQPAFLLLKNAGQFMTTMVGSRIDLVLHGHQHWPAFSKATYPIDAEHEHTIIVVGAGSVGKEPGGGPRSYNLITIKNGREINLERRELAGAQYNSPLMRGKALRSYDDARRIAFEELAQRVGAKLRVRKASRLYLIKSGSGDADIRELFEDVTAYSEEVKTITTEVQSESGFFFASHFDASESQDVKWEWTGPATASRRAANVRFDPPLTKDSPVTYKRYSKAYNLFHFNQQDRMDATEGKSRTEFIELAIQSALDLFVLTVSFPEGQFPPKFYQEVHSNSCYRNHSGNCVPDAAEQQFFKARFSKFADAGTFVVSIENLLPGYTYWIYWDLPKGEGQELGLKGGQARDLIRKLLALRDPDSPTQQNVVGWMASLKEKITEIDEWSTLDGDDEMEVWIHTYDAAQRGLVCTGASIAATSIVPSEVIKPGKFLIGAAYRRREPMIYSPFATSQYDEAEYDARVPASWRQPGLNAYSILWSMPLKYPIDRGQRVAVLTLASRSDTTKLLNFVPTRERDLSAARDRLMGQVIEVQFPVLAGLLRN
jgi:3',5'-cyclic AMP phosphodiesterase CpdA